MIKPLDFFKYNKEKMLTLRVWFLSAFYRMFVLFVPAKYANKYYGAKGEESDMELTKEGYNKAWKIAFHVNRIGNHTPWETKCLVKALTAQHLLTKAGLSSTLYLGVKRDNGKMVAHAWIRTGEFYLTGGDGTDYAMVAKFRK